MAPVYIKNARQIFIIAQGFEPKPAEAVKLLTDTLAYALHQAGALPDDAIAHLRDSYETIEAAKMQSRPPCPDCNGNGGYIQGVYSASCDTCAGTGHGPARAKADSDTSLTTHMFGSADCTTSGDSC